MGCGVKNTPFAIAVPKSVELSQLQSTALYSAAVEDTNSTRAAIYLSTPGASGTRGMWFHRQQLISHIDSELFVHKDLNALVCDKHNVSCVTDIR